MRRCILNCVVLTGQCSTACTGEESRPECISLAVAPEAILKELISQVVAKGVRDDRMKAKYLRSDSRLM